MVATARRTKAVRVISALVAGCGLLGLVVMALGAFFGFRGATIAMWPILCGFMLSFLGYILYQEGVNDEQRYCNLESFICDVVYLLASVVAFALSGLPWAWAGTLATVGIGTLGLLFLRSDKLPLVNAGFVLLVVALLASLATIPLIAVKAQPIAMPAVTFSVLFVPLLGYGWVVRWRFITEMCAEGV